MINGKGLLSPPASTSCSIFFFEILFDVVIAQAAGATEAHPRVVSLQELLRGAKRRATSTERSHARARAGSAHAPRRRHPAVLTHAHPLFHSRTHPRARSRDGCRRRCHHRRASARRRPRRAPPRSPFTRFTSLPAAREYLLSPTRRLLPWQSCHRARTRAYRSPP